MANHSTNLDLTVSKAVRNLREFDYIFAQSLIFY